PLHVQITGNPLYDGKHLPAIALFSGFQNCSNQSKFRITDLSPISARVISVFDNPGKNSGTILS
ncbi:hypothetical protein DRQ26_03680, partial [bacterium]